MFVFHIEGRERCVLSFEGLNVKWMSSVLSKSFIWCLCSVIRSLTNRKLFSSLDYCLICLILIFAFLFCSLSYIFENVSWGYLGGLDSLSHLEVPWIPLADLGYWWKPAVAYYIFQYPFVKANRICLALHRLRGKLIRWYLLAVQYSISVFYNKACLPFITLTVLCECVFSISMNCLWKLMWNIYSAKQKQFLCRWWIAR